MGSESTDGLEVKKTSSGLREGAMRKMREIKWKSRKLLIFHKDVEGLRKPAGRGFLPF
jgi:hypothetical protein